VAPAIPASERLMETVSRVRKHPMWSMRLPPALFFSIVAALALLIIVPVAAMKYRAVKIEKSAVVDKTAEQRAEHERALRLQVEGLIRQGRVTDAYQKLIELQKLAPRSSYVTEMTHKLSLTMRQEDDIRQKTALAKQKFDEGVALYNEKRFAEAIVPLSESFSLNPNSEDTTNYLKLAQQEDARAKAAARQKTQPLKTSQKTPIPPPVPVAAPQPAAPSSLTLVFNHPFADGTIVVKAGMDLVARETLWQETRFLKRHEPRPINVTTQFPPKNADLEIWVDVPSLRIKEYHVMQRQSFQAGVNHKLTVSFDPNSKTFGYALN
jgi:tetratricopeptide (TPR) repeat protein